MSFKKSPPIWVIQYRWRADAEWVPLMDCDVVSEVIERFFAKKFVDKSR